MSQKTIVTQAEIAPFKDALNDLASNLNAHINHSLSKAHGLVLVSGFIDSAGNNLTTYQNSNGDIIGTTFVRFAIGGVLYYAPGISTALAGQSASTGSLDINPDVSTELNAPGASSLITEYGSIEIQQAVNVNSLLLEHTRKNHDIVHSLDNVMRVIPKTTLDSGGYTIGRYVVRFVVNGVEYEIPCDTRLGGPPQLMRGMNLLSNTMAKHNASYMAADDDQYAVFTLTGPTGGTRPYTVVFQMNQKADGTGVWNNMTNTSGGDHAAPNEVGDANDLFYNLSDPTVLKLHSDEGSGSKTLQCTIRCVITNDAGTYITNYGRFYAEDTDGCGFISGPETNGETYYEAIPGSPPIV